MFELGQWAIPLPFNLFNSSSLKYIPWANHTSGPIHPVSSISSTGLIPYTEIQNSSSSIVSARCVCSITPFFLANSAELFIRLFVTENGEHGARATLFIA